MNFNYEQFRAEFIRKKSQSSFERVLEAAALRRSNHYRNLSDLVHARAAQHQAHPPQAAIRSAGKILRLGEAVIKDMIGSGLVDPQMEIERARGDWWQHREYWIQGERRTFYWVDNESEPNFMVIYSPDTEHDAIGNVRRDAASIELARKREQERAEGKSEIAA